MSGCSQVAANLKITRCAEKIRLVENYKASLDAILALESRIDITHVGQYFKLLASIDTARKLTVQAHEAVNEHVAGHGC
jgi:hypothetical protein